MLFIPVFINRQSHKGGYTITPEEHRINQLINSYLKKSAEVSAEDGEAALKKLAKHYGIGGKK